MSIPFPTPILRFIHKDNLHIYLRRGGIHAPNNLPNDGLEYKTIHDAEIQSKRSASPIPCGLKVVYTIMSLSILDIYLP